MLPIIGRRMAWFFGLVLLVYAFSFIVFSAVGGVDPIVVQLLHVALGLGFGIELARGGFKLDALALYSVAYAVFAVVTDVVVLFAFPSLLPRTDVGGLMSGSALLAGFYLVAFAVGGLAGWLLTDFVRRQVAKAFRAKRRRPKKRR
ncbi:MAG: hypothetical protein KAW41_03115 [Candidatus Diapherotrites archaeon]|nr:hypothetical protein [Candidatus Diapherotrites archaeon]